MIDSILEIITGCVIIMFGALVIFLVLSTLFISFSLVFDILTGIDLIRDFVRPFLNELFTK